MNDKFFELEKDRQLAIINAGLEVFAKNDYKKASTQEIATKAGVSKGLLFYYFHNKQELYEFLFSYTSEKIKENVAQADFYEITDFFEIMEYSANVKVKLLVNTPYIMDFVTRGYYAQNSEVKESLGNNSSEELKNIYDIYFKNVNTEKFKEGINPKDVYEMIVYMTIGYMYETQKNNEKISIDDIMEKYRGWCLILKNSVYKPKYL